MEGVNGNGIAVLGGDTMPRWLEIFFTTFRALCAEWVVRLTGGVTIALLTAWFLATGKPIPQSIGWAALGLTFTLGSFAVWRKEWIANTLEFKESDPRLQINFQDQLKAVANKTSLILRAEVADCFDVTVSDLRLRGRIVRFGRAIPTIKSGSNFVLTPSVEGLSDQDKHNIRIPLLEEWQSYENKKIHEQPFSMTIEYKSCTGRKFRESFQLMFIPDNALYNRGARAMVEIRDYKFERA
jgi:hypothetical protein